MSAQHLLYPGPPNSAAVPSGGDTDREPSSASQAGLHVLGIPAAEFSNFLRACNPNPPSPRRTLPCTGASGSRNDVGQQLVLDARDLIPELQLALLEPGHPELIGGPPLGHRRDGGIQIPVLLDQRGKRASQALLLGLGHRRNHTTDRNRMPGFRPRGGPFVRR